MIEDVLRALAEENFGDQHYPVLHGSAAQIKPFALMVKVKRSILKRPLKKEEFRILAGLEHFVQKDKNEELVKAVNSKKQTQDNLEIMEYDEDDESAKSYTEVGLKAANLVDGSLKISYDLGELELGKLDEEYFLDTDLDDILRETELDPDKMERYKNEKLRLIYSVIYSEKFHLKGKRQRQVEVDAGVNVPVSIIPQLKAKLRAHFKQKTTSPKAVTRNTRGPVYFKCISVDYDKEKGKMKLREGEFVGKSVHRAVGDEEDDEYRETTLAFENEENDLTDEDFKKLEIIKEAVLKSVESRERRREQVKKYLQWFEEALTGNRKLRLPDDKPLTPEDCDFLQSMYCPVLAGNQHIVDLSSFDTEKIQGYAIVLKLIDDLSDEQWDEIEKAWAEPE